MSNHNGEELYKEYLELNHNLSKYEEELKKIKLFDNPDSLYNFFGSIATCIIIIVSIFVSFYWVYFVKNNEFEIISFIGYLIGAAYLTCIILGVLMGIYGIIGDLIKKLFVITYKVVTPIKYNLYNDIKNNIEKIKERIWEIKRISRIDSFLNDKISSTIPQRNQSSNNSNLSKSIHNVIKNKAAAISQNRYSQEKSQSASIKNNEQIQKKGTTPNITRDTLSSDIKSVTDLVEILKGAEQTDLFASMNDNDIESNKKLEQIDFIDKSILNNAIGELGEIFVIEHEKKKLNQLGILSLSESVKHISKEIGNHAGYDILSYAKDGSKMYIEVKTTTQGLASGFFITDNELQKLSSLQGYFIYRVYNFDIKTQKGQICLIKGLEELNQFFTLSPNMYKVSLKKHKLK